MKRLLAAVAAIALIGGAWWIRQNVIEGDDGGDAGGQLRLLCGTELEQACRRLADGDESIMLRVEPEGTTADRLSSADAEVDFDAWLAAGPWAQIVADNRRVAGLEGDVLGDTGAVLGRSPVTVVGPRERVAALASHCGGTLTWVCLGDSSGQQWASVGGQAAWGTVKAGLAPPDGGAGLVALDQAVADRTDRTDWDALDLQDAEPWLSQLVGVASVDPDPLNVQLTRPGSFSFSAPLEQASGPRLAQAANGGQYSLLYPEPMVTADVTLTAAAGQDVDDLLDRLGADRVGDELAADGWQVDGRTPARGVGSGPALPSGSQLTSAGALQALREQWEALRP